MVRWHTLLICGVLSACAGQPTAPPRPDYLFHDAAFRVHPTHVDVDVFALNAAMQHFLQRDIADQLRRKGRLRGLADALQSDAQLRLEYDSAVTHTAAEAFDARSGNCLSLVIMTAALAKELGLPVHYQHVYAEETWSRDGDILFRNGHVNLVLGRRLADRSAASLDSPQVTIDFLPENDLRGYRTSLLAEATIVAMFMNNRAAEALARGQLDDAYWWARAAIVRDSAFLDSYNTLGVIYSRHHDLREAEQVFRYLLERSPDNPTAMANLAAVLKSAGRPEASQALLQQLRRIEPYPPFYFFDRGQAALRSGDLRSARDLFEEELKRNPDFHAAHFRLAAVYFQLGDLEEAREHLTAAMANSTTRRDHDLYAAKLQRLRAIQLH